MTGQIIPLHGDEHREAQLLLPWYATGRLDAPDRARFAAHLATCAECQAELALERRLATAVSESPVEVEPSWERLRGRLPPARPKPAPTPRPAGWRNWFGAAAGGWGVSAGTLGWAVAAQFVMLLLLGSLLVMRPFQPQAGYHVLGTAPAAGATAGNLVVIFRPDTPEKDLRAVLQANALRLVDGPTAAGAYVLRAEPVRRTAALAALRADHEVVLAEPIDAGGPPR